MHEQDASSQIFGGVQIKVALQRHSPLLQICVPKHAFPQLPQLLLSVEKLTHAVDPGHVMFVAQPICTLFPAEDMHVTQAGVRDSIVLAQLGVK